MTGREISPASRWRRTLAGLVDVAIAGGVAWLWRRRAGSSAGSGKARWAAMFTPAAELIREQLASPGQWLFGVRTVDRRTGRRVEPWRTLVLLGASAGGQLLVRRLTRMAQTPEQERDRDHFMQELSAVNERYPAGSRERDAEMRALMARPPSPIVVNPSRAMAASLAVGLINNRLRRRLAPTIEVPVGRRGASHSP
ncbi:MAG TPA: hypothetical protein VNZ01_08160 [Solirubrobacteraceae bacterium]|nr:hypothetical protein [Solirubrobacteraceae bacterium]